MGFNVEAVYLKLIDRLSISWECDARRKWVELNLWGGQIKYFVIKNKLKFKVKQFKYLQLIRPYFYKICY